MLNRTPYYHVEESHGGTYTIEPSRPVPRIGTTGCHSCVGIYLPISSSKCFVAHIDAFVKVYNSFVPGGATRRSNGLRRNEGEAITKDVRNKLEVTSKRNGWSADDVVRCMNEGGKKTFVVCPHPEVVGAQPWPHVIKGVEDFLGGRVDLASLCRRDAMGFVVNHVDGNVDFIDATDAGWKREGEKYEHIATAMEDKEWTVEFSRW